MFTLKNKQSVGIITNGLLKLIISFLLLFNNETINAETVVKANSSISQNESSINNICLTQACQNAQAKVLSTIDENIDPCSNFYKFVCGGFEKNNVVPKSAAGIDQFTIAMNKIIDQVKQIVEEKIDPSEMKSFKLVKTYYASCINTTAIDAKGLQPLNDIIKKLGGWPVVDGDSWKDQNFSWDGMNKKLFSLGFSPKYILSLQVVRDLYNASKFGLHLDDINTNIKQNLLNGFDDQVTQAYYNLMVEVAVQLGADRNRAVTDMKDALTFEMNLLNLTVSSEDIPDEIAIDHTTISRIQKLFPYISWLDYLNNITSPLGNFNENSEINLMNSAYMYRIPFLLNNTSKRVISNYMIWKAIEDSIIYLPNNIRNKKFLFDKVFMGKNGPEYREKECVESLLNKEEGLLVAVTAMYVKKYLKNDTKEKVNFLVSKIINYNEEILKKNTWLNDKAKEMAIKKNKAMKRIIGYPDELRNVTIVDKYYENLQLAHDDYFDNVLKMKKFVYLDTIGRLQKTPDETFWLEVGIPPTYIPHYNFLYNTIVLPASSLQLPFYDDDQPNYMNFGSFGMIVGHEISHAFELETMRLNVGDSISKWLTEEDLNKYKEKFFCFIEQFNNFTVGKSNQNRLGFQTLNENIADNQGLKIAFNVYENLKKEHGMDLHLPNLNYTNDQLFWINAGSTLCSKKTKEAEQLLESIDVHAPEEFRILGYVANSEEFAKSFNCPLGSPMNPEKKCTVW